MLRDGPALAIPYRDGETGPAARLWRRTGEQHLNLTVAINPSDLTLLPADRRMLEGKRNPSTSPRGLTPGWNRNWAVGPEPK